MELISREDLLERMKRKNVQAGEVNTPKRGRYMQYLSDLETIKEMPPITSERKTGKWISEQPWCLPKCSICGASCFGLHGFDAIKTPYCPTCGAKMEVQDGTL